MPARRFLRRRLFRELADYRWLVRAAMIHWPQAIFRHAPPLLAAFAQDAKRCCNAFYGREVRAQPRRGIIDRQRSGISSDVILSFHFGLASRVRMLITATTPRCHVYRNASIYTTRNFHAA